MKKEAMYFMSVDKLYEAYKECVDPAIKESMREVLIDKADAFGISLKMSFTPRGPVMDVWCKDGSKAFFIEGASTAREVGAMFHFIADELETRIDAQRIVDGVLFPQN